MEWQDVTPDIPVRQGDLLVLRCRHQEEMDEYALVLTADCDIAQRKHGSAYAVVSVVNVNRYIRGEWSSIYLDDCREKKLEDLLNSFNKQVPNPLQHSSIENWVRRASFDQIASTLGITNPKIRNKFEQVYRQLLALLRDGTDAEFNHFELLVQYLSARDAISENKAKEKIFEIARTKLQSLPSDLFLLTMIQDEMRKVKMPGFVLLRHLLAIPIANVTTSAEDARDNSKYLRIGRLRPTYKYAITQQFSSLYGRIGFPPEYDTKKVTILQSLSAE